MIPAAKSVAINGAASAASPAQGMEAPATAFDAILSLETLAATVAVVDPAVAAMSAEAAGLEGLVDGELIETRDSEADDGEDEDGEGEGALAFLADLLNVVAVAHPVNAGPAPGEPAANDDALPGAPPAVGERNLPLDSETAAADKLAGLSPLSAAAELAAVNAEGTRSSEDIAGVTRAAEWVHGTRQAPAGAERSSVATHVRDPRWAEEFGTRIALMVRAGESSASLQLSPVELGPLDVSVTVRDSQASIHFGAAQAETRALIEASIPRLREMLAAQGFQLTDSSVSSGSSQGHREQVAPGANAPGEAESPDSASGRVRSLSLLDVYA